MKTRSSPSKKLLSVPEKRLVLYGVAAGAALAAGASQSDAALITLDLTGLPINTRTTPIGGPLFFDVNAASATAAVGTANFAAADFRLNNLQLGTPTPTKTIALIFGTNSAVNGIALSGGYARNFATSDNVNAGAGTFNNVAKIGSRTTGGTFGNFQAGDTGYLGLHFALALSDNHYGWANITLNSDDYTITLNSLGYESVADPAAAHVEPAAAVPEPSTIVLLALGAVGVAAFRNRQRKAA